MRQVLGSLHRHLDIPGQAEQAGAVINPAVEPDRQLAPKAGEGLGQHFPVVASLLQELRSIDNVGSCAPSRQDRVKKACNKKKSRRNQRESNGPGHSLAVTSLRL